MTNEEKLVIAIEHIRAEVGGLGFVVASRGDKKGGINILALSLIYALETLERTKEEKKMSYVEKVFCSECEFLRLDQRTEYFSECLASPQDNWLSRKAEYPRAMSKNRDNICPDFKPKKARNEKENKPNAQKMGKSKF